MGSTSVMVALGKLCGAHDSVGAVADQAQSSGSRRNMTAFVHLPTGGNHATPEQIKPITDALWGEALWQQYTRLTIVRNPWARAVSWWDYARNELGQQMAFSEALKNTERPYWFDANGTRQAQIYLRCESLDEDYQKFCTERNLATDPLPRLRRGARDPRKPYWEYFNTEDQQTVADNFALEIATFGYRFGDPA